MQLEYTKATFAAIWILLLGVVGLLVQPASVYGWIALVCVAFLPPIVMWRVWTAPRQTMSESIRDVVR